MVETELAGRRILEPLRAVYAGGRSAQQIPQAGGRAWIKSYNEGGYGVSRSFRDTENSRRRVYVSAPPSLAAERATVASSVYAGGPAGGRFVVSEPDAGIEPRKMIDEAIRSSDFFVLLLKDHWRERRQSGPLDWVDVEAEFELAWACLEDELLPMRGVAVLFFSIEPEQLKAPGFQLQQVQLFRRHVERTGRAFVGEFDQLASLSLLVTRCLGVWEGVPETQSQGRHASGESAQAIDRPDLIREAMRLADAGRIAGAEACFALAVSRGDDVSAHVAYGGFLRRLGRLTQAIEVLEKAVEYADGSRSTEAAGQMLQALTQLAQIHLVLGDTAKAEGINRRATQLAGDQQNARGQAAAFGNEGAMHKSRGDLEKAASAYREALKIEERLGNEGGVANQLCNLGLLSRRKGDLEHAETMLRKALSIDERLGRLEAMANGYGNIGLVLKARGDLTGAESSLRRAMALNEAIGRIEGLANDYYNLGDVARERGQLDESERLHLTSLGIEQRLARVEGIARSMEALAIIDLARGKPGEARQRLTTSMQIFARGGMRGDEARVSRRLRELGV